MYDSSNQLSHSSDDLVVIIFDHQGFQEIWYELSFDSLQLKVFKNFKDGFNDLDAHVGFFVI